MSESRRRPEANAEQAWAQQNSAPWTPHEPEDQGIDPSEAAEFRRRLDYQASTQLIPIAGPDAPADQGPAIKAVWEPAPPYVAGQVLHRRDHRISGHGSRIRGRRRRTLVVSGVAVVAIGITGYTVLTGKGGLTLIRGSATTVLPAESSGPGASQSAGISLGSGIEVTNGVTRGASPGHSATSSPTSTASSTSAAKSTSTSTPAASQNPSAPATQDQGPPPVGASNPAVSPSPDPTQAGNPPPPAPSPSPSPTPSPSKTKQRSCFLFFCS